MTIMFVVVQWFSGCCCGWPSLSSAYSSSSRRTRASSNSLIILAALLMILCSSQLIAVSEVRFSDPTNVHLQVQHLLVQPQHFVASNSSVASIGDVAATRPHRRSRRHCPSCRLPLTPIHVHRQTEGEEEEGEEEDGQKSSLDVVAAQQQHQTTIGESARLESIKRQILIKLGLNAKPNLLSSVIPPRDFILETLLRAEESSSSSRPHQSQSSPQGKQAQPHHPHHSQADGSVDNVIVDDDFYGKTSEIIAFGEPGPRLNGQILAEFSRVQETAPESSLRVKSATLWIYVQLNGSLIVPPPPHPTRADRHVHQQQQQQRTSRSPTLYVFRLLSSPEPLANANASGTSDKGWNELLLASQKVTIQHSGWMKINISEGVQKWFGTSSSQPTSGSDNKLRLLVDCSGCGSNVQPVLFVVPQSQQQVDALGSDGDGHAQQTSSSKKKKKKKRKKRKKRKRRLVEEEEEEKKQQEEDQRNKEQQQQVQHRPFIVIHTDSSSSRRLRRRTPLDCSPTTSACCKQRFFVSFRALGWDDWIIAPSGYYANYCRGDCGGAGGGARAPESFLSYHSHVIDQVRKQLPLALSSHSNSNNKKKSKKKKLLAEQQQQQQQMFANYLQPCCAPTKFSSMSLIYFGPDMNIIKRDLPKMVVDECGCP